MTDKHRIDIPAHLRIRMREVARDFRKTPTPSEHRLWQAVRRGRIQGTRFRRQHPIGPSVVDFFCAHHALIVEVDGPIHQTQQEHDRQRQLLLEACGYRVLRLTAADVETNLDAVVERIAEALGQEHGHSP